MSNTTYAKRFIGKHRARYFAIGGNNDENTNDELIKIVRKQNSKIKVQAYPADCWKIAAVDSHITTIRIRFERIFMKKIRFCTKILFNCDFFSVVS